MNGQALTAKAQTDREEFMQMLSGMARKLEAQITQKVRTIDLFLALSFSFSFSFSRAPSRCPSLALHLALCLPFSPPLLLRFSPSPSRSLAAPPASVCVARASAQVCRKCLPRVVFLP